LALRPTRPESRTDQLAQRQSAQQDVFLREVDDALREDEMRTAFARYGTAIGAAVAVGLLALGGYLYWDHSQNQSAGSRSEQFTVALDSVEARKLDEGATKLAALAKDNGEGTRAAAQLLQGGIAAEQGKKAEALRLFNLVAADGDAPQPYRDLAAIRAVGVEFDTMKPEDAVTRLKPLAQPGKPWFGSAAELLGLAYLKQNRKDLAGPMFAAIARDKEAPDSLRNRARQMAGLLGVDAIDDVARAAGTQPGQM
jgi:hypothetical protein